MPTKEESAVLAPAALGSAASGPSASMPPLEDAYDHGRYAHNVGISSGANPWPAFDQKYQQWAMGWMDAHNGRPAPKPIRKRKST